MIFSNLWGLLLLLAIPVLILIYIIKRENRERAVSGTYLWHLSERFLKKRLPIKRLSVFLTFLLQLIILSLFALSAMQPAMALGQFSGKIVVIDASASMLTEQDGVSRFDAAVEKAKDLAESGLCSSMTVIVASDTPACLVMGGSMSEALDALDNAACGYGGMDLYEAMKLVREASSRIGLAGQAQVILYSDTEFAEVENVEVVDMRRGEKNLAVTELTHSAGEFQGTLVSYGEDREVAAGLYVDGELLDMETVSCLDGVPATVLFDTRKASFETATLRVELEDSLEIDNSFSIAGPRSDPVSVLVLGEEVLFFEKGFEALGNCEVTVKESYHKNDEGLYDLYIFSGCVPHQDTFPKTGVTIGFAQYKEGWSFTHSLLNSFYVTDAYYGNTGVEFLYDRNLEIDPIWDGMEQAMQDVYIRYLNYYHDTFLSVHISSLSGNVWEPLLGTSSHSKVLVLRRILENDARHYLFMFPLSQTNLAMTPAFLMLLRNACGIAAPPVFEKSHYSVGETVDLSPQTGAASLVMTSPDGTVTELAESEVSFIPTSPGLYTLTYEIDQKPPEQDPSLPGGLIDWDSLFGDGSQTGDKIEIENDSETDKEAPRTRTASFFAHIPPSEYETFSGETIYYNNTFHMDPGGRTVSSTLLPFTAVILTALLILEWGYFYRGKH